MESTKEHKMLYFSLPYYFALVEIFTNWKVLSYAAFLIIQSVQFSRSVMSDSCPSPTPGVYPNPCPLSWWWHPTISSSVIPFTSCPQSLPASESFQMCQLFTSGGQVLEFQLQYLSFQWTPGLITSWITLQSKGLSKAFSNTTVQKHQFFGTQLSSQSNCHIHTWPLEKP